MTQVLIIGGGPAGLMAAETAAAEGHSVTVAEAMPTFGRKFLMAGKSGLNLTNDQDMPAFLAFFGPDASRLAPMITAFGPKEVMEWAEGLGQPVFTGSSGRVFPQVMKASPLLRAWLLRLENTGVALKTRHRWTGLEGGKAIFETPDGPQALSFDRLILALGGASWPRLGSNGQWTDILTRHGVDLTPFQSSNAALSVSWSDHMRPHFGKPLKAVAFQAGDMQGRGEAILSQTGIEGGGIYPFSSAIRDGVPLTMNLTPDRSFEEVVTAQSRSKGKNSLSNHLRKTLGLTPEKIALLNEFARPLPNAPEALAKVIQALPIHHDGLAPLDRAISSVGGVPWGALNDDLSLTTHPNIHCIGEMVDWDAPTGGYLLTACLAMGRWVGKE
jgi:uncharacterized flavoprotein (TIGR03862 family)